MGKREAAQDRWGGRVNGCCLARATSKCTPRSRPRDVDPVHAAIPTARQWEAGRGSVDPQRGRGAYRMVANANDTMLSNIPGGPGGASDTGPSGG